MEATLEPGARLFVRRAGERAYHQRVSAGADPVLCGENVPRDGWPDVHDGIPPRKLRCVKCSHRAARAQDAELVAAVAQGKLAL